MSAVMDPVPALPIPPRGGIGLRFPHHRAMREARPDIAWLEVHPENYMGGGAAPRALETLRADYPLSLHGVGLSLGSADGIDDAHLDRLAAAVERFAPALVSEHLAFSVADNVFLADLLPLPLTEESLTIVSAHVDRVQSRLKRRILVENPSTYLQFTHSTIAEPDFLAALAARTGCGLLVDVNNIFVSASNHGWDALAYLRALPRAAVGEIHLAGHSRIEAGGASVLLDAHGSHVCAEVWALYDAALALFGPVPTLIEWDNDIPPLATLIEEAARADARLIAGRGRDADARAA